MFSAMAVSESQLGVPSVLSAKDMINPEVDHIGVMAYAAWHRHAKAGPVPPSSPPPPVVVAAPPPPPPPVVIPVPEPAAVGVTIVENWHVDRTTTITVSAHSFSRLVMAPTAHRPNFSSPKFLFAPISHRPNLSSAQFLFAPISHRPNFSSPKFIIAPISHRPNFSSPRQTRCETNAILAFSALRRQLDILKK